MVVGFQKMDVKHPHVILINVLRQNDFPKQVSHTSYFVCTHILHFTTLLLRHSMEAIAATSLYVAAKWNNYDIKSEDGEWYRLFSRELTLEEVRKMADEFTQAFQACDVKIKNQVKNTLKMNFNRHQVREDSAVQARRTNDPGRACNRAEKRPHEPQSTLNQQQHVKDMLSSSGGGVFSTNGQQLATSGGVYDDSRSRMKVPRVCSPKSQPPPQIHNQTSFPIASHPDSASALKREEAPKHPDSVGGSYPSVTSRTSTTSNARNDLSSIF
ncbi:Cyclin-T2 [Taenia solium]|eukprot:TsM_000612500 transcript=TsM_000612500 gene=TsM_000612500